MASAAASAIRIFMRKLCLTGIAAKRQLLRRNAAGEPVGRSLRCPATPSLSSVALSGSPVKRGRPLGSYEKSEINLEELTRQMAGGAELEALAHELRGVEA